MNKYIFPAPKSFDYVSPKSSFIINIAVQVFILFTFLSLFYIYYASKIASKTFKDEIDQIDQIYGNKILEIIRKQDTDKNFKLGLKGVPLDELQKMYV